MLWEGRGGLPGIITERNLIKQFGFYIKEKEERRKEKKPPAVMGVITIIPYHARKAMASVK